MTSIKKYDNNFKQQNKRFSFTNSIYDESTCKNQVSTVVQNMDLHMALGLVGQHCSSYKENVTFIFYYLETRLCKRDRSESAESAPGSLHVQFRVPHGGNGTDRLDHMADHVDDGQVDDGPVDNKQSLDPIDVWLV